MLQWFAHSRSLASLATIRLSWGYVPISPPGPTAAGDKVEVVEAFSYGCVHCFDFQPEVDAWLKRVDKSKVQFTYLPATFNRYFALMARGYYAASSMGVATQTHQQVFDALFTQRKAVNDMNQLADLYASLGVDRAQFLKTAESMFVQTQLQRANDLMYSYFIDGTPTIIVAGKYRVDGDSAGGNDKIFTVVDKLVERELAERKKK
jgi:protein dithiol oxidoreductase (disulfide-forming)